MANYTISIVERWSIWLNEILSLIRIGRIDTEFQVPNRSIDQSYDFLGHLKKTIIPSLVFFFQNI